MPKAPAHVHPYIPNSAPQTKAEMLKELGIENVEALFSAIPTSLRLDRPLNLPEPLTSEAALRRHVNKILERNISTADQLSFLGGGCYQHYVPAVCDEINQRSEFLTAYSGKAYEDHGRWQALFEYASLMAELLNMEVVNLPTYDGLQAAATAMRMAFHITGRSEIICSRAIHPEKVSKIIEYNHHLVSLSWIDFDPVSGQVDLRQLEKALSDKTAAVYFENPNFFGVVEAEGQQIANLAHKHGALCIVGAEPISLGVLKPPADYGADIACGDIQALGMHPQFGGGQAGYIATRNEQKYVMEYPNRIIGLVPTRVTGEYGFGEIAFERTSFTMREKAREWVGTMANLWGITAGVYLALMGPQGLQEVGDTILKRVDYAQKKLGQIPGLRLRFLESAHFREFVVDFSNTNKTVAEINQALLERGIFGGYDLTGKFPNFDKHAMLCFTENHTREDIDLLVRNLAEVLA